MNDKSIAKLPPSKNALKHGLYASDIVLPWERTSDFLGLLEDFRKEWCPDGATEYELVSDLAHWRFLKRRLVRMAQLAVHKSPFAEDIAESGAKSLKEHRAFLQEQAKSDKDLRASLNRMVRKTTKNLTKLQREATKSALKSGQFEEAAKSAETILNVLQDRVLPMVTQVESVMSAATEFERFYAPDTMAQVINLQGMVDTRFEKTLARLIMVKEYKRINAPKTVSTL